MHVSESDRELMLPIIEQMIQEQPVAAKVGIVAVPCMTLDERQRLLSTNPFYFRGNANGVDLNRNFDGFEQSRRGV